MAHFSLARRIHWAWAPLAFFIMFCFSAVTHAAPPITDAMVRADSRLEKKVTYFQPRAPIGEVLESWSAQTGVTLEATEADDAANVKVCVLIRDVPLYKAMNALHALLSFKPGTWRWTTRGATGAPRTYTLRQPTAAHDLPITINAQIQDSLRLELENMIAALDMSPEELAKAAKKDESLILLTRKGNKDFVAGIRALGKELSKEERTSLFTTNQQISRPVESMGEAGRAFLQGQSDQRATPLGANNSAPTYMHVQVSQNGIAPSLFILVGDKSGGDGNAYAGGTPLKNRWKARLNDLWQLGDDTKTNPSEDQLIQVPAPETAEAAELARADDALKAASFPPAGQYLMMNALNHEDELQQGLHLWELAAVTGIPVMARLQGVHNNEEKPRTIYSPLATLLATKRRRVKPNGNVSEMAPLAKPYAQTVGAYLGDTGLLHKWRDDFLLVTYGERFVYDATNPKIYAPWSGMKWLATKQAANHGYLTIPDLIEARRRFTPEQIAVLRQEWGGINMTSAIPSLDPILAFYTIMETDATRAARWRSSKGILLDELDKTASATWRDALKALKWPAERARRVVAVRWTEEDKEMQGIGWGRNFMIEGVTKEEGIITWNGLWQKPFGDIYARSPATPTHDAMFAPR